MFNGLTFLNKDDNSLDGFFGGTNFNSNEVSNLADIFEADESDQNLESNPSLKYIPKKSNQAQKPSNSGGTEKSKWDVAIAKLVSAYKLVADANTSIGQRGLALLKNPTDGGAKLILYKTKDHILSSLQLTKTTKVYWKPPYLQYHDTQQEFWSLFFTSDNDATEFFSELGEVCIIDRANAATPIDINATTHTAAMESTNTSTDSIKSDAEKIDSIDASKVKPDVVYRVAKIGHQLPKMKATAKDEENDSTLATDTERIQNIQSSKISAQVISGDRNIYPPFQIPSKPTNISVALQPTPIWPSLSTPTTSTFDLNAFASENRIQNTEVRMNLSKLDSKLDRVLDNVERLWLVSSKSNNAQDKEEEIIKLEEKVLELKKENRVLKLQLNEGAALQNKEESNKKDMEIELQKRIDEKEHKIAELTSQIQELIDKNRAIEEKFTTDMDAMKHEHKQSIDRHTNEMDKMRTELESKTNELKIALHEKSKEDKDSSVNNGELIRSIMNQFYGKLLQSIEGKSTLTSVEVLKLTAEIIRKETKAALNSS